MKRIRVLKEVLIEPDTIEVRDEDIVPIRSIGKVACLRMKGPFKNRGLYLASLNPDEEYVIGVDELGASVLIKVRKHE